MRIVSKLCHFKGFTLIEALLVILISGFLILLVFSHSFQVKKLQSHLQTRFEIIKRGFEVIEKLEEIIPRHNKAVYLEEGEFYLDGQAKQGILLSFVPINCLAARSPSSLSHCQSGIFIERPSDDQKTLIHQVSVNREVRRLVIQNPPLTVPKLSFIECKVLAKGKEFNSWSGSELPDLLRITFSLSQSIVKEDFIFSLSLKR